MTDYTEYQDLVMDTSVYLVGYDGLGGLLVTNDNTENCLFVSLFTFLFVLKKNLKKT